MNERNLRAASTLARLLIDEADALLFEVGECLLDVVNAQCDVLDAAAAVVLLDELRNRRSRLRRCEQLDLAAVRRREEARRNFLLCDSLFAVRGEAERVTPESTDFLEVRDSDADMVDS